MVYNGYDAVYKEMFESRSIRILMLRFSLQTRGKALRTRDVGIARRLSKGLF